MPINPIEEIVALDRLKTDLSGLGIKPGMSLVVHSSLSSIGFVLGGAPVVVRALLETVGEAGTLVMPAATPFCADPAKWPSPELDDRVLEDAWAKLPLFDQSTTPTSLGAIPETFRNWPGTLRSNHPLESVCANGRNATIITESHPLEFSEGPGSPFHQLYELGAWILLLGVGFNRCTALHYAETVSPKRRTTTLRFPEIKNDVRVWTEIPNVADDNDTHFPAIGKEFMETSEVAKGNIGDAPSTLFRMQDLVPFAVSYFDRIF